MIYLDTNVVVAACLHTENSAQVSRLFRGETSLYVSRLADYEARKCLASLDPTAESNLNLLFLEKFSTGKEWEAAILQALKLSRQFKERLWVDSADTLHVGWALAIGADVFASFDRASGPRALAKAVGLKVWPAENSKDYAKRKLVKS